MTDPIEEERRLRRFLLNEMGEEERQCIEERFLVDPEYREQVLAAEADLVDEYAAGSLPEAERRQVAARLLSTPEQRRGLRLGLLIKKYVDVETAAHSPPPGAKVKQRGRNYIDALGLRRPYVFVPLAAVLLISVGLGVVKLAEFRRASERRAREQALRAGVERELTQLNGGTLAGSPVYSVDLAPVFVRDLSAAPKVSPPADAAVVELRLVLVRDEYEAYRAVFHRLDDPSQFAIPNLRASGVAGGRAVNLKVPARLLTPGDYQVRLSGVGADGTSEEAGEYNFHVTD